MMGSSTAWVGAQSAAGVSPLGLADMSGLQFSDGHDFVAARVDHLDGDTIVLARWEGQGLRALEGFEGLGIGGGAERLGDLLPRVLVGEEGLADAETAPVEVRVEEPRGDFLGASRADRVLDRVVD